MGPILEPDPHGMDPKTGPKMGPGRILIKPEALLHDIEYQSNTKKKGQGQHYNPIDRNEQRLLCHVAADICEI